MQNFIKKFNFIQQDFLIPNFYRKIRLSFNPPYIGIEENIEIERFCKGFEPNIALSPT